MDVSGVHFTVSTNYFFSFPFFLHLVGKQESELWCIYTNSVKDVEIDSDLVNGYEQAHVMW